MPQEHKYTKNTIFYQNRSLILISSRHLLLLPSDQREPSLPTNPERSALSATALQQRAFLLFFLFAGEPAAAGHLWGSPAEQAEALPDNAAAVWQRHFPRDRRQRQKLSFGPCGKLLVALIIFFNHYLSPFVA